MEVRVPHKLKGPLSVDDPSQMRWIRKLIAYDTDPVDDDDKALTLFQF